MTETFSVFKEVISKRVPYSRWGDKAERKVKLKTLWQQHVNGERFFVFIGKKEVIAVIYRVKVEFRYGAYVLHRVSSDGSVGRKRIIERSRPCEHPHRAAERAASLIFGNPVPIFLKIESTDFQRERMKDSVRHPGLKVEYHTSIVRVRLEQRPPGCSERYAWEKKKPRKKAKKPRSKKRA